MNTYSWKRDFGRKHGEEANRGTERKWGSAVMSMALVLTLLLAPLSAFAATAVEEEPLTVSSGSLVGAAAAKEDGAWTLEDMMTYAIQDEYLAEAEYDAIMAEFGVQRPFSNIIRAEQTHIALLLPLFAAYDIAVPVNDAASRTVIPESLSEIYAIGVTAEVENIAMYEAFLKTDLPDDVRGVFERLMNASVSHQRAFENAASRSGTGTTASAGRQAERAATRGAGGYRGGR